MPQFQPRQKAVSSGQTPIHKFTTKGEVVEGVFKGRKQLNPAYRPLVQVGDVLVTATTRIEEAFETIPVGAYVWITWNGKIEIKGGKTLNDFDVDFALPEGEVTGSGPATQAAAAPSDALKAEYEVLAAGVSPAVRKAVESMFPDLTARIAKLKALAAA
jgi:hypothetical protein